MDTRHAVDVTLWMTHDLPYRAIAEISAGADFRNFSGRYFSKNRYFSTSTDMPIHTDRPTQYRRWFASHILDVPERRALLLDAYPGDDRWLAAVPNRSFPKRCRTGIEHRHFKCDIRKVAFEYLDRVARQNGKEQISNRPADSGSDEAPTDNESNIATPTNASQASA